MFWQIFVESAEGGFARGQKRAQPAQRGKTHTFWVMY